MPYLLSPMDLVSRPDNMDETVLHTQSFFVSVACSFNSKCRTMESSQELISMLNQILRDQDLES